MSKRQRSRQRHRQRRFVPRPAPQTSERATQETRATPRESVRPRYARPGSIGRASGPPSNALLRAATLEYGYVVKDLRRIGVVVALVLALLAAAMFIATNLFP
jgi:hypothetical protein